MLERLEGRDPLSTLTAFDTSDSGPGPLRDRIEAASIGDTIVFDGSLS
jgi:hypothetical protein